MIGIIGAMDVEIEELKNKLKNIKEEKYKFLTFYLGEIENKKIVLAKCYEGKVNAAICTQIMCDKYMPEYILNIGVAGGITPKLDIGGIAISDKTVECDLDTTQLGYELGYEFACKKVYILSDKSISNKMFNIAKNNNNTVIGTICSSDKFISDNVTKNMLEDKFNAIAVDMESGSIAHVCALNDVPFCAIRAISDNVNAVEYKDFVDIALKKLDEILINFLKEVE